MGLGFGWWGLRGMGKPSLFVKECQNWLLQDLVYAFFPFLEDETFPCAPSEEGKTGFPLKDWFVFLSIHLNHAGSCNNFRCFFEAAKEYCKKNAKKLILGVDRAYVFYDNRYQIREDELAFFEDLIEGEFSHKVFYLFSYIHDYLCPPNTDLDYNSQILRTSLEGLFSRAQLKQLLVRKCKNLAFDESQLEKLITATGSFPFEISEFCQSEGNNFDLKLKTYIRVRSSKISKETIAFFAEKFELPGWKERFLTEFFSALDTQSEVFEDFSDCIDKRYLFIEDRKLMSVSPIVRETVMNFCNEKLIEFENEKASFQPGFYKRVFYNIGSKNDFFREMIFEKLIISQLLRKRKNEDLSLFCYDKTNEKQTIVINFSRVFFSQYDVAQDNKLSFFRSALYVPNKFMNRGVDLYFYNKNNKTLYAIKITTSSLSMFSHQNSESEFKKSMQYQMFKTKNGITDIAFIWITEYFDSLKESFCQENNENNLRKKRGRPKSQKIVEKNSTKNQMEEDCFFAAARENKEIWEFY